MKKTRSDFYLEIFTFLIAFVAILVFKIAAASLMQIRCWSQRKSIMGWSFEFCGSLPKLPKTAIRMLLSSFFPSFPLLIRF
jgi:hypothetical protein